MKAIKSIFVPVFLMGILLLGACKKDNDNEPEPEPDPQTLSFSPGAGSADTIVTIKGSKPFSELSTLKVKFGSVEATEIIAATETEIKVKVPKGLAPGRVKVTVPNSGGELWGYFIIETTSWSKTYGGRYNESAMGVARAADGGYLFYGEAYTDGGFVDDQAKGSYLKDWYLIRVDKDGNKLWSKIIGGLKDDYTNGGVIATNDGGFAILGGYLYSTEIKVYKLDDKGNILWQSDVRNPNAQTYWGNSIAQLTNGDLVVTGYCYVNGGYKIIAGRLNNDGVVLWNELVDGSGGNGICATPDGGFVITGATGSELTVIKYSANNQIVWNKNIAAEGKSSGRDIVIGSDGAYYVTGLIQNASGSDAIVVKLGANGNVIWQKTYGGNGKEEGMAITKSPDDELVVLANTQSNNNGDVGANHGGTDIWVFKITRNGFITGQRMLGGDKEDLCFDIIANPDTGYTIAGGTSSSNSGDVPANHSTGYFTFDPWCLKISEL